MKTLGKASQANENILDYLFKKRSILKQPKRGSSSRASSHDTRDRFDVFLCHNSKDKPAVRKVARFLKTRKVRPWLDEEQLRPGLPWQMALEEQIGHIDSAAVFVGSSGIGPWQQMELWAFLSEFVRRRCPVIPVVLSEARQVPELPIFMRQLTWVDLRENSRSARASLIWGITGKRPN
jgi:hypothetical protein